MRCFLLLCVAGFMVFTQSAEARCDSGEYVIRFSHNANYFSHPKGQAAERLKNRVNSELQGVACMEVFGNGLLYRDEVVLSALVAGDIHLAAPSVALLDQYSERLSVFSLPFAFRSLSAVEDFLETTVGRSLKNSLRRENVEGLGFWILGMRQFVATDRLEVPEDLNGEILLDNGSVLNASISRAVGASAKRQPLSEVYYETDAGNITASSLTWSDISGRGLGRLQKNIVQSSHSVEASMLIASTSWIRSLNPQFRSQLMQIIAEVTVWGNDNAARLNQEARRNLIAQGVQIKTLTREERTIWIDVFNDTKNSLVKDLTHRALALIKEINVSF